MPLTCGQKRSIVRKCIKPYYTHQTAYTCLNNIWCDRIDDHSITESKMTERDICDYNMLHFSIRYIGVLLPSHEIMYFLFICLSLASATWFRQHYSCLYWKRLSCISYFVFNLPHNLNVVLIDYGHSVLCLCISHHNFTL